MPRVLGGSWGGGWFLMSEVPLSDTAHLKSGLRSGKPLLMRALQGYLALKKTPPPLGPS